MHSRSDPRQNHILAALPESSYARWAVNLEVVHLEQGRVLYERGSRISHAYFPTTAMVSLICVTANKSTAELALVGREGMTGTSLFMGVDTTFHCAEVQTTGAAWRLRSADLVQEFNQAGPAMHLLLRYTQALLTQMSQIGACNRHHSVFQQVCRRILENLDRQSGLELLVTQQATARLLGTERQAVARAMNELRVDLLAECTRGRITVLNRGAIAKRACECYGVIKKEYERLLPSTAAL